MNEIKYLNVVEQEELLKHINKLSHKCMVLLMLDAGLRVTECVSLTFNCFDFKRRTVKVRSLKKRDNVVSRTVPISDRLYQALANYLAARKDVSGQDYVFPSRVIKGDHVGRSAANKFLAIKKKQLGMKHLHPHALRHSFAVNHISAGTPLENIKTMLGHTKYDTTLIYATIPTELLRKNVEKTTPKKVPLLQRLGLVKSKDKRISLSFHKDNFTVGRNTEIGTLEKNIDKGINTLLLGPIGVGKSHILENFKCEKKILRLDDSGTIKKSLGQLLLYLYQGDKSHVSNMVYGDAPIEQIEIKLSRESLKHICGLICSAVQKKEYILCIDRVDNIPPKSVQALEMLKDHFIILAGARLVKIDRTSFLWNFDTLEIKPLTRVHSIELINRLSYDVEVEDFEFFRNHIFEQTNGNPRAIFEIIDRYRKEPVITNEVVREIRHTASLREIDLTFVIFIGFGLMYVLRYMSREVDNDSLRFIGGIALVMMLLSRQLLSFTKRKFL